MGEGRITIHVVDYQKSQIKCARDERYNGGVTET